MWTANEWSRRGMLLFPVVILPDLYFHRHYGLCCSVFFKLMTCVCLEVNVFQDCLIVTCHNILDARYAFCRIITNHTWRPTSFANHTQTSLDIPLLSAKTSVKRPEVFSDEFHAVDHIHVIFQEQNSFLLLFVCKTKLHATNFTEYYQV